MKAIDFVDNAIKTLSYDESLLERYNSDIACFEQSKKHWQQDKVRVGVIGVTSSGKSTMINSILGDMLLSMAVKPSSSQLVSCSKSENKKATVFFQSGKKIILEGKTLTAQNIKKYSDENYNMNNKEDVAQLELSTPSFDFGKDVLLIDSPGLDAYGLQNHEELTLEVLLPSIDVCIFVTTLKTNSDAKMSSVLDVIAKYKCPIIIVQNMLDSLKPSVDGKKSIQDVAAEHKRRVERIVNSSKLENKDSVKIVQISAAQALKSRCDSALNKAERKEFLKKSNYEDFLRVVHETLEKERPTIENQRINSVAQRIKKIIYDGKEDLEGKMSSDSLIFEYEGLDTEIERKEEEAEGALNKLLKCLDVKLNQSKEYTEVDIKHIKKLVKKCEKEILEQISNFNNYLSKTAEKINIPSRDIVSVNGLPSMPELTLRKKTEVKSRRVKKSGFGSKVSRFFGGFFDTDWGYEYVSETVTVIDNAETKKELENYILRAKSIYVKEINSWAKKTRVPIDQLIDQIENRRCAFEERRLAVVEEEKLRHAVKELEVLISNVKETKVSKNKNTVKSTAANVNINYEEKEFTKNTYNIARLADTVSNLIFINTTNLILNEHNALGRNAYICGWDISCMASFAKRFCGIVFTQKQLNTIEKQRFIKIDKYNFYFNPTDDDVINFMSVKTSKNIYILTNTTQYGSAQTQIHKSGICYKLLKDDFLSFVIQDFTEIINGNGISEGVHNMMLLTKNLNIQHPALVLINHENPIYNLTIIEAQKNPCEIMKQETAMLMSIQKCFNYLRNEIIDKQLADIIRAVNQKYFRD